MRDGEKVQGTGQVSGWHCYGKLRSINECVKRNVKFRQFALFFFFKGMLHPADRNVFHSQSV